MFSHGNQTILRKDSLFYYNVIAEPIKIFLLLFFFFSLQDFKHEGPVNSIPFNKHGKHN